jgi:hypothetical protein
MSKLPTTKTLMKHFAEAWEKTLSSKDLNGYVDMPIHDTEAFKKYPFLQNARLGMSFDEKSLKLDDKGKPSFFTPAQARGGIRSGFLSGNGRLEINAGDLKASVESDFSAPSSIFKTSMEIADSEGKGEAEAFRQFTKMIMDMFMARQPVKEKLDEFHPDQVKKDLTQEIGDIVTKEKIVGVYNTIKRLLGEQGGEVQIFDKDMKIIATGSSEDEVLDKLKQLVREGRAYYIGDEFQMVTLKKGSSENAVLSLTAQALQLLQSGKLKESDKNELRYTLRDMQDRGMKEEDLKKFAKMVIDKTVSSETKQVKSQFKMKSYKPADLDGWRALYKSKKNISK